MDATPGKRAARPERQGKVPANPLIQKELIIAINGCQ
ncbi:Uncharacterised protein [Bordetella pertussis]|nr:Uncharacterised protein [Bordetella pertussis]CFW34519.1 Uncharacterised protein [Bordetella pertussis]